MDTRRWSGHSRRRKRSHERQPSTAPLGPGLRGCAMEATGGSSKHIDVDGWVGSPKLFLAASTVLAEGGRTPARNGQKFATNAPQQAMRSGSLASRYGVSVDGCTPHATHAGDNTPLEHSSNGPVVRSTQRSVLYWARAICFGCGEWASKMAVVGWICPQQQPFNIHPGSHMIAA
jgi:hypothetical protein